MQIPEKELTELVNGMRSLMHVMSEPQEQLVKCTAKELIAEGITETITGQPIRPGVYYMYPRTVIAPIDHDKRIRGIIEQAQDMEEMHELCAAHLLKYGKPEVNNINNTSKND